MSRMRFAVPVVDRRGAGLGNELILWGKAFIAGQMLGMQTVHPAWGINRRGYWRHFRTSRFDYVAHQMLRRGFPSERFNEADYIRHGGGDFANALLGFAQERGLLERSPFVLELAGLWGGPGMLGLASDFIRGELLATRWAAANLFTINRRVGDERLRIGVHIRRGDFSTAIDPTNYAGKFNLAVPLDWYAAIIGELHRAFGERAVFVVTSDARPEELASITRQYPCVMTHDIAHSDVSDLLALADSDFLICSISSFSLWAAILGRMPYAWFAPQLTAFEGTQSIWGHQLEQQQAASPLGHARAGFIPGLGRGVAVGMDGHVPDELLVRLDAVLAMKARVRDLVRYGVVVQ